MDECSMEGRSPKWLHRVGYVMTLIVAVGLMLLSIPLFRLWQHDREWLAAARERTRTHQGPIIADTNPDRYRPDEFDVVSTLPALRGDGLRFVAMPSLRGRWYAISVSTISNADRATGMIRVFSRSDNERGDMALRDTINFWMRPQAVEQLVADAASLTNNWGGERTPCFDGTGVAFELSRSGSITSGMGNSACSEHYGQLSQIVLQRFETLIPIEERPTDVNWRKGDRSGSYRIR